LQRCDQLILLVCGCSFLRHSLRGDGDRSGGDRRSNRLFGGCTGSGSRLWGCLSASGGHVFVWLAGKQGREGFVFAANTTVLVFFVLVAGVGCYKATLLAHVGVVHILSLNLTGDPSCLRLLLFVVGIRTVQASGVDVLIIVGLGAEKTLVCLELVPSRRSIACFE
jgi:hypothetical protein